MIVMQFRKEVRHL